MDMLLDEIQDYDSRYIMQTYRRTPVAFVRGEGCRLYDTEGKEYLDMLGGIGVVVVGHNHPRVIAAICEQAGRLLHTSNLFYIEPQAHLAKLIAERIFEGGRSFFANSGAEANEGALKLARKYHYSNGESRKKVIAVSGSFHGRTLQTLSATGQPDKWEPFKPLVPGFVHVPMNDTRALDEAVDATTAAVIVEPILGEAGVHILTDEFLKAARSACDREGALLIADEVQSGMGRTGKFFAFQQSGILPDIVTMAKGLANGIPIGAVIANERCSGALGPGDHGSTFGGGFLACSAAVATVDTILENDLVSNASDTGGYLIDRLQELEGSCSSIAEVRGRGLMVAIQFADRIAEKVFSGCMDHGVVVNRIGDDIIRMLPPLTLEKADVDIALAGLADAIEGAVE